MQLHDDAEREFTNGFHFAHFENRDAVVTGCARFPGHLHMRHPITDPRLHEGTYTRALRKIIV